MKRSMVLLACIAMAVVVFSGSALALCICLDNCPGNLAGCYKTGEGSCWQTKYNRCDGGVCGAYDPYADDCQYACEWFSYHCERAWPLSDFDCEKMTEYFEFCIPE